MALTDESTGMVMPVAPAYGAGYGNGGFGMGGWAAAATVTEDQALVAEAETHGVTAWADIHAEGTAVRKLWKALQTKSVMLCSPCLSI